jgi:hypothetical protein
MGVSCDMHQRNEKCMKVLVRKPERKIPLGILSTDKRIILKLILQK